MLVRLVPVLILSCSAEQESISTGTRQTKEIPILKLIIEAIHLSTLHWPGSIVSRMIVKSLLSLVWNNVNVSCCDRFGALPAV